MPAKAIPVVAGVLVHEGLFLVAKRHPGGPAGGQWEFPGGKVEASETPQAALKRELFEELALNVTVGAQIGRYTTVVGEKIIALDCYWVPKFQGTVRLTSHSEYAWVEDSALLDFDFAEPDLPAVIAILARGA